MTTITGATRLVGIVGDPVRQVKGFAEYAEAFAARGLDAVYLPMHVRAGELAAFLAGARRMRNLAGLVATIPHKQEAFALAEPDAAARRAGSANLLRPAAGGGWECSMADGAGFVAAVEAAGMTIRGRTVQILGAGGAGRAVAMAAAEQGPARIAVHDTDCARAERLAADIAREFPGLPVAQALGESEMLVNCSPVGMNDDTRLPLSEALIPRGGDVYDIVNRPDTPLVVAARRLGCRADHGRSMMLAQIPIVTSWLFGP
jgi:shikimate dehydrogenase